MYITLYYNTRRIALCSVYCIVESRTVRNNIRLRHSRATLSLVDCARVVLCSRYIAIVIIIITLLLYRSENGAGPEGSPAIVSRTRRRLTYRYDIIIIYCYWIRIFRRRGVEKKNPTLLGLLNMGVLRTETDFPSEGYFPIRSFVVLLAYVRVRDSQVL